MAAKNAELRASTGVTFVGIDQLVYVKSHYDLLDGVPLTFAPTAHGHGNLTDDGKIGTTSDLVVTTTTGGVLTVLSRNGIDSRTTFPPALSAGYGDTVNPYASKTAKYILAAPNAAAGSPSFRLLVASDLPAHAANASTYGYGDTINAGHLRVGAGLSINSGTVSLTSHDTPVAIAGNTTLAIATHANKTLTVSAAAVITIPANASVAFPIGTVIDIIQTGTGEVSFAITTDTLVSEGTKRKINAQYQGVSLKKIAATTWVLIGALKA